MAGHLRAFVEKIGQWPVVRKRLQRWQFPKKILPCRILPCGQELMEKRDCIRMAFHDIVEIRKSHLEYEQFRKDGKLSVVQGFQTEH